MKLLLVLLLMVCLAVPVFAGQYQEFTVNVTTSLAIPLNTTYRHIEISTPSQLQVRFMTPAYNANGDLVQLTGNPLGDPQVPQGSGFPDVSDTTMTVFDNTVKTWNIYNDANAKRIHLQGTATGVIIRMLRD